MYDSPERKKVKAVIPAGLKLRANAHLYRPPGAHWAPRGVLANSTEMYLAHFYETPDNVVVV